MSFTLQEITPLSFCLKRCGNRGLKIQTEIRSGKHGCTSFFQNHSIVANFDGMARYLQVIKNRLYLKSYLRKYKNGFVGSTKTLNIKSTNMFGRRRLNVANAAEPLVGMRKKAMRTENVNTIVRAHNVAQLDKIRLKNSCFLCLTRLLQKMKGFWDGLNKHSKKVMLTK
ncbi:TPA: hypothetical protein DEP26_04240 [Candidatus Uhrbacteria bacterium]|nr:hypothetical protein [Candidatus Uhrbacteria bacterium]